MIWVIDARPCWRRACQMPAVTATAAQIYAALNTQNATAATMATRVGSRKGPAIPPWVDSMLDILVGHDIPAKLGKMRQV